MLVPLAGAALLLSLFAYYDLTVYRAYLLRGDEPAFVSATLESPASWFTRGYLNYFHVYPEWVTRHASPLLKPVTNAVGYLNYSLFGSRYALHFAVFFLIQFLGLLVFVRLLRELAVPPLAIAGMALLFLFNPAFMNAGLTCLSCHFDVFAGVFALAAFLALWRERYGVALLLLTLAVFTKESAVFAPLTAALSMIIWRRPLSMSALMLLPLPVWGAARFLAYGDVLDGRLASPVARIATGLTIWPTGLVPFGFLLQLGSSLPFGRTEILSSVFLIANIGLWIFLGYAAWVAARRHIEAPAPAKLATALLVWTLGALSFGVLVGYHARYGGSIYPFLYLFFAALIFSSSSTYRIPRWAAASVLLVFSAATFVQSARSVRLALVWESVIAPERALHAALRALPQDGRTIYVVNAPPGMASAPRYLNFAWSLNLKIVIVNQFDRCATSSDPGTTQFLAPGANQIGVRIPDCATFDFGAAALDVSGGGSGAVLQRNGIGTYHFPDGVVPAAANSPEWGRTMTLRVNQENVGFTLVGYDWESAEYRVMNDLSGVQQ